MKKLIAALLLILSSSATFAQVTSGLAGVVSGAKWSLTNISVSNSDLFYVALDKSSSNALALDLVINASRFVRFSTFGDVGTRAGGVGFLTFVGYGYVLSNGGLHMNLRDALGTNWDCYVDSAFFGSCNVWTINARYLGQVRLRWAA